MKTQIIATAGKGGTGKSMIISHLLKRHILGNGFGRVLVVDADPHRSLTSLLGVQPRTNLGELRHKHGLALKTGRGLEALGRRDFALQLAQEAIVSLEGGDLLVMGHNNAPGCQCVVNNILGSTLDVIASQYRLIVIDNEAGIEPIGRHAWPIDFLLLVSSPKLLELDVAWQILRRAQDTQRTISHPCLILNRTFDGQDFLSAHTGGAIVLGTLPYSSQLAQTEIPDGGWLESLDRIWIYLNGIILQKEVNEGVLR